MRVRDGGPDLATPVFEDEDVGDVRPGAKDFRPFGPQRHHQPQLVRAQ